MAAKKTRSKQSLKQKSQAGEAPGWHIRWPFAVSKLFVIGALGLLVYTTAVVILTAVLVHANEHHGKTKNMHAAANTPATPPSLAQNTYQVHACSDSITSISSYTYSAKYFFDLAQQGYHLAGTLSQQASDGQPFTDSDCKAYFALRAVYPANHIILQLFTRDASGNPLPYQYKDLKPETCYSSDTTNRTVCPHAPSYGIFVKD